MWLYDLVCTGYWIKFGGVLECCPCACIRCTTLEVNMACISPGLSSLDYFPVLLSIMQRSTEYIWKKKE